MPRQRGLRLIWKETEHVLTPEGREDASTCSQTLAGGEVLHLNSLIDEFSSTGIQMNRILLERIKCSRELGTYTVSLGTEPASQSVNNRRQVFLCNLTHSS